MQVHLPCTSPLDFNCRLSEDECVFPFATKGLLASTVQSVLSILTEFLITAARVSIIMELPSFSCLCKDTKVIWKILFLLWDKLLSSHLVVNSAGCDIFKNASYNGV